MKSKSGKIEYRCPNCSSPDIRQTKMYGQNSGWRNSQKCRTWWPWKSRLKISLKNSLVTDSKEVGCDLIRETLNAMKKQLSVACNQYYIKNFKK